MLPNEIWVNHVANKVKCCELTFEEMTYYLLLCKKFKHKSYVANDRFNNLQVDSQKIGKYYIGESIFFFGLNILNEIQKKMTKY